LKIDNILCDKCQEYIITIIVFYIKKKREENSSYFVVVVVEYDEINKSAHSKISLNKLL
jgi:hypothetical protein